jgi:hypothetical protein
MRAGSPRRCSWPAAAVAEWFLVAGRFELRDAGARRYHKSIANGHSGGHSGPHGDAYSARINADACAASARHSDPGSTRSRACADRDPDLLRIRTGHESTDPLAGPGRLLRRPLIYLLGIGALADHVRVGE